MPKTAESAKLAHKQGKGKKMELSFATYGLSQFTQSNESKMRAYVSLAIDTVSKVQGWKEGVKPQSRAECEAALSIALTMAKTETRARQKFVLIVKGLVTQAGKDFRDVLAGIRSALVADGSNVTESGAVDMMVAALVGIGAENLGSLEAYAKGGKVALASAKAAAQAKIDELERRAAMTEKEAQEAAAVATQEAQEAADNQTPRSKAAKGVAAILAAIAKHGPLMEPAERDAIVSAMAELQKAALSVANEKRLMDIANAAAAKKEAVQEAVEARKAAKTA